MSRSETKSDIKLLQKDLLDFIEYYPEDCYGLAEYWYIENSPIMASILSHAEGFNIALGLEEIETHPELVKKLSLIFDNIILRDNRDWSDKGKEIRDIPIPIEYKQKYLDKIDLRKYKKRPPLTLFNRPGLHWSGNKVYSDHGADIAYACAPINSMPKTYFDWISGAGKEYIENGHVIYAPFIPPIDIELDLIDRQISPLKTFNAKNIINGSAQRVGPNYLRSIHDIFDIRIPTISGVSLDDIDKIKQDNYEPFLNFQESLEKAITEIENIECTSRFDDEIHRIGNEHIKDAINKMEKECKNLERSMYLRKAGLILTGIGLTACVKLGAPPYAIISGAITGIVGTLYSHYTELGEIDNFFNNKNYFIWKIKKLR